jgi:PAS domain S-box-containing protein
MTMTPVTDPNSKVLGAVAISRDVSDLNQAQRQTTERDFELRRLLEHSADAVYGVLPDGTCAFANTACVRLLGYDDLPEVVGKNMHQLAHHTDLSGRPVNEFESPTLSIFRTGVATHGDVGLFWRKDGSCFSGEFSAYPMLKGEQLVGAVVSFFDLAERKRLDAEAREAVTRGDSLLAVLSHELRNPLAALQSATRVLGLPGIELNTAHKAQEVIRRQSNYMARLLDDLLDVVRIARGTLELRLIPHDIRTIGRAAVESIEPLLGNDRARFHVDYAPEPVIVNCDPSRLQQVFFNLLSNAVRRSGSESPIVLTVERTNTEAVVTVSDEGQGIEPTLLSQIFEFFVQREQTLEPHAGGMGIGLGLVKHTVELHHGTVSAESSGAGRGSRFCVRLPLQPARRISSLPPQLEGQPKSIVLIEDQDDSREMLGLLLRAMGHQVTDVSEGVSGVALIARQVPDVAIIDIGLPGMNGYEVARSIRATPSLDHVKLVALTGYGSENDVLQAKESGFDAHITKPADPKALTAILGLSLT